MTRTHNAAGEDRRRILGLLWMRRTGSGRYRLYKVWTRPAGSQATDRHGLEPIDDTNLHRAIHWAHDRRWADHGIWTNCGPGLLWCGDLAAAEQGLGVTDGIAGARGHVQQAPVRYSTRGGVGGYPLMAPRRSPSTIRQLRERYPQASEDLAVTPLDVLIEKYDCARAGAGRQRQEDPHG